MVYKTCICSDKVEITVILICLVPCVTKFRLFPLLDPAPPPPHTPFSLIHCIIFCLNCTPLPLNMLKCRVSSSARSVIQPTFCKSILFLLLILKMIIIYQIETYHLYSTRKSSGVLLCGSCMVAPYIRSCNIIIF